MAMKLVKVTANLNTEAGPLAGATIRAEIDQWDFSVGGSIAMPAATSVRTDANGRCVFHLWCTSAGAFVPKYRITIHHYSIRTRVINGVAVPDVDEISLTRLLGGSDSDAPIGAILVGDGYLIVSGGPLVFI